MAHRSEFHTLQADPVHTPRITSYDSGYENSLEHWAALRQTVEQAENEPLHASRPAHTHGILIDV